MYARSPSLLSYVRRATYTVEANSRAASVLRYETHVSAGRARTDVRGRSVRHRYRFGTAQVDPCFTSVPGGMALEEAYPLPQVQP